MNNAGMENVSGVVDKLYRPLHDLRVSVTDRCNFRCVYCMPKSVFNKDYKFLSRNEILSWDNIVNVVKAAAPLGCLLYTSPSPRD